LVDAPVIPFLQQQYKVETATRRKHHSSTKIEFCLVKTDKGQFPQRGYRIKPTNNQKRSVAEAVMSDAGKDGQRQTAGRAARGVAAVMTFYKQRKGERETFKHCRWALHGRERERDVYY
jgi:hypothetical protein